MWVCGWGCVGGGESGLKAGEEMVHAGCQGHAQAGHAGVA